MTSDEPQRKQEERIAIPLNPKVALRALLQVDPTAKEATEEESDDRREKGDRRT